MVKLVLTVFYIGLVLIILMPFCARLLLRKNLDSNYLTNDQRKGMLVILAIFCISIVFCIVSLFILVTCYTN